MLAHAPEPETIGPMRADALTDANACAFLRLRSLHFWRSIVGVDAEFAFAADGGCARGVFAGVDAREREFCVEALATPLGVAPSAKIRSTDVVSITLNLRRLRDGVSGHESDQSAVTVEDDDDVKDDDDAGARSASESESWLEDA